MRRRAADLGALTATVARPFRHITPGEQIRLEAAARVEDARSSIELLTRAIAATHSGRVAQTSQGAYGPFGTS